jgi:6-phosphogluconolactonase (cycloisomerase 2 family)
MRFSPTKLLHGLLYSAPIMLLTLVACGGGGGSSAPLDVYFTVSGTTSGLTSSGLVLRNNGGDDQTVTGVASGVTGFSFPAINTSYNVTVLIHPSSPSQLCTVSNGSGARMSVNVTNVAVSCVQAFTIGGSISGVLGTGLVLQNNGGDNLQVAAGLSSYTFSTPLAISAPYAVTVISQPYGQDCIVDPASVDPSSGVVSTVPGNVSVDLVCSNTPAAPPEDRHVYTADFGANTASAYQAASGVITIRDPAGAGAGPSSIAVDPAGKYVYVTNKKANTINVYSITAVTGALVALADVDTGITGDQPTIATGNTPVDIAIHPSGRFAYVVNQVSNSISAYSIDANTGELARIDTDGGAAGNPTTIPTRLTPVAIAIHPNGEYAYVANAADGNGSVSVYSIDPVGGELTAIDADGVAGGSTYIPTIGTNPSSLKVDPAGQYLYVANRNTNTVDIFAIDALGTLSTPNPVTVTDGGSSEPVAIVMHPAQPFVYVVNRGGSGTVNVYDISTPGLMTHKTTWATGSVPISMSIDRSGQYAYVANYGDSTISAYSINPSSGALTAVGIPFTSGTSPISVTTAP